MRICVCRPCIISLYILWGWGWGWGNIVHFWARALRFAEYVRISWVLFIVRPPPNNISCTLNVVSVFFSSFILLLISRTMTFNIAFNPQHSLIRRRQTGEKKTLRSRRRINKNRKSNAYPDAKHSIYKYIYRNRGSDVCQLALPCNSVCFGMLSFDDNSFRLFSIECRDCSTELLRVEWTKKTHRNLRRHTKKTKIKKSINSCFLHISHNSSTHTHTHGSIIFIHRCYYPNVSY